MIFFSHSEIFESPVLQMIISGLLGRAPKALCTKGTKFVLNWTISPHSSHCVYAKGWDRQEGISVISSDTLCMVFLLPGTVFCLNSWGKADPEPHISSGNNNREALLPIEQKTQATCHLSCVMRPMSCVTCQW